MHGSVKSSTINFCDQILNQNIQNDAIFMPTPENTFNVSSSVRNEIPRAKLATKVSIQQFTTEQWNSKVQNLVMQGDFAKLLMEEKQKMIWKILTISVF